MITTRIDTSPEHLKQLLGQLDLTTDQLAKGRRPPHQRIRLDQRPGSSARVRHPHAAIHDQGKEE